MVTFTVLAVWLTQIQAGKRIGTLVNNPFMNTPKQLWLDSAEKLYISNVYGVKIYDSVGGLKNLAGSNSGSDSIVSDDGPATAGRLDGFGGVVGDLSETHVYFGEVYAYKLHKVNLATGIMTRVAGDGQNAKSPPFAGEVATSSGFLAPHKLARDTAGKISIFFINFLSFPCFFDLLFLTFLFLTFFNLCSQVICILWMGSHG